MQQIQHVKKDETKKTKKMVPFKAASRKFVKTIVSNGCKFKPSSYQPL